jgi:hypothetical protein
MGLEPQQSRSRGASACETRDDSDTSRAKAIPSRSRFAQGDISGLTQLT